MRLCLREHLGDSPLPLLEVAFSVHEAEGQILEWLGPAKIVESITMGTGITRCDPDTCAQTDELGQRLRELFPEGFPTAAPVEDFEFGVKPTKVTIFRGDTPTALIAACGCYRPLFLTVSNCLTCAIRTGYRFSWENFAIVCGEQSYTNWCSKVSAIQLVWANLGRVLLTDDRPTWEGCLKALLTNQTTQ